MMLIDGAFSSRAILTVVLDAPVPGLIRYSLIMGFFALFAAILGQLSLENCTAPITPPLHGFADWFGGME